MTERTVVSDLKMGTAPVGNFLGHTDRSAKINILSMEKFYTPTEPP